MRLTNSVLPARLTAPSQGRAASVLGHRGSSVPSARRPSLPNRTVGRTAPAGPSVADSKRLRWGLLATLVLSSCGILPTRNSISIPEQVVPFDKALIPFDLLFHGQPVAAVLALPMLPFVELGELFSGRSVFPPAFSGKEWRASWLGVNGETLYAVDPNAKQEEPNPNR